jgi:SAM-dependent methyltransferase
MARLVELEDAQRYSPKAWIDKLLTAARTTSDGGLIYPSFPSPEIQRQFVGSTFDSAMKEALAFYLFTREYMHRSTYEQCHASRYLDFGCGWGRFSRVFLRDFARESIIGVDIDDEMINFCKSANLPGQYLTIGHDQELPFPSESVRLITAYSVFTHLPPKLFEHWIAELGRVMAPGALLALTVEPPRFLSFVAGIRDNDPSPWHRGLAAHKKDIPNHRRRLETDGIAFLPTGGGGVRTPDIYGDTVVIRGYIESAVANFGEVLSNVDDPGRFWQAAVVIQKG